MVDQKVEMYLVGGAVRDQLLNTPVTDRDWVVVGASPEWMIEQRFQPIGQDFPVFLHPQTKEEYALARTERKSGRGYKGFSFYAAPDITLEQDLLRRDLTINAMAMDNQGQLIDLFGGFSDLQNAKLRHVSKAFAEDPLRVLRVARFAAQLSVQDFSIASETLELMGSIVSSGELLELTPERVWLETQKALKTAKPRKYFEVLHQVGALEQLFPEISCLFGVPQTKKYHPEVDTGLHVLMSLDQICKTSSDVAVRFAVLVHDLGKGTTPKHEWPSHKGHEARGVDQIEKLCDRLNIANDYRDLAKKVSRWHLHCHKAYELKASTIEKLFSGLDLWRKPDNLEKFLLCCTADARGRTDFEDREYAQADYLKDCFSSASEVHSQSILGRGITGPEVGEELRLGRIAAIQSVKNRLASN